MKIMKNFKKPQIKVRMIRIRCNYENDNEDVNRNIHNKRIKE